jgi:hypothetical protein
MTIRTRRQLVVLVVLTVAAVLLLTWQLTPTDVTVGGGASPAASSPQGATGPFVGDIGIDRLGVRDNGNREPDRDVFRFESRRSATPPPREGGSPAAQAQTAPSVPSGPPPPPPIPLRYIGYLDQEGAVPRIAVLSDGRGNVFNGREGDIIEGRYRVLRIGTDSADLIYVDGRGRQTIRLSGQ